MTDAKLISKLVYDRKGPRSSTGETIVLIHGIGHRRQAWGPVFDRLAEEYDVIAVDLAGFGESPAYDKGTPYNMDNACADLTANFATWGVERPHVVGNSLGGAIALELGARGDVSSVTALSPAGFFGTLDRLHPLGLLSVLRIAAQLPDSMLKFASKLRFGRILIGAVLYAHPGRKTAGDAYGDALALKRCKGFMPTIKAGLHYKFDSPVSVPTTIAWGTRDLILLHTQAAVAKKRLPNARHEDLAGSGHVPMTDDPERIVALVRETVLKARAVKAA